MLIQHAKEFMFENDMNTKELSKLIGVSSQYMGLVLSGKKRISERMEYKIRKLIAPTDPSQQGKSKKQKK